MAKRTTGSDSTYWEGYMQALKDIEPGFKSGIIKLHLELKDKASKELAGASTTTTSTESNG